MVSCSGFGLPLHAQLLRLFVTRDTHSGTHSNKESRPTSADQQHRTEAHEQGPMHALVYTVGCAHLLVTGLALKSHSLANVAAASLACISVQPCELATSYHHVNIPCHYSR